MRLAQRLGAATLAEVEEISAEDLQLHQAIAMIDGWDSDPIADILAAIHNAALVIAASNGRKVYDHEFATADNFRRRFPWETGRPEPAEPTPADLGLI